MVLAPAGQHGLSQERISRYGGGDYRSVGQTACLACTDVSDTAGAHRSAAGRYGDFFGRTVVVERIMRLSMRRLRVMAEAPARGRAGQGSTETSDETLRR
jgi:hypothetical protein